VRGDPVEEPAVVGNDHRAAGKREQGVLQGAEGVHVEIVGRFIQQQQVAPAPEQRRVGQMMGIWFVGAAMGNLFAGLVAGRLETLAPTALFRTVAMIIGGAGIVALVASPVFRKMMGNVR
jgi:dipeptide/tripeptide permease